MIPTAEEMKEITLSKLDNSPSSVLQCIERELIRLMGEPHPHIQMEYSGTLSIEEIAYLIEQGYQVLPRDSGYLIDWSGLDAELFTSCPWA